MIHDRSVVGYEVVIWNPRLRRWENDWDGELHTTRQVAEKAKADASTAGYDAHVAQILVDGHAAEGSES